MSSPTKRPRYSETEALIQEVLQEEQQTKQTKKSRHDGQPIPRRARGATLADIEQEEGGVVKESLVGMAHTKRSLARKKKEEVDDTELIEDTGAFEEALEVEEEDGVTYEPFNLEEEREKGYFNEEGAYVERKDDAIDAWLASDGATVVSAAVRKRLAAQEAARAAAEAAGPLSEEQVALMKHEVAGMLRGEETIITALKRLGGGQTGGKVLSKRQKLAAAAAAAAAAEKGGGVSGGGGGGADPAAFARLTELADSLLTTGELDIYSASKRQLERESALYAPAPDTLLPAAPAAGAKSVLAAADDDDDMFASNDAKVAPPAMPGSAAASGGGHGGDNDDMFAADEKQPAADDDSAAAAAAPAAVAPAAEAAGRGGAASAPAPEVDYASWPIRELRRFLEERGQNTSGIVEKGDLVQRVRAAAAAGPEGAAPEGYVLDPSSGYFYSEAAGMYYDTTSGGFCSAATGEWFTWDPATQQFVAWGRSEL